MKYDERSHRKQYLINAFALLGVGFAIYCVLMTVLGERGMPTVFAQQQDPFLSRRVDQIENRFYSLESRLNRVEQEASRPRSATPSLLNTNDSDIQYLRSQIDSLRLRVGETECALLRLDERTLTVAARQSRVKAGPKESDKCRVDTAAPLQLSARP
ncbi:MAG: hypothetical protein ABJB40_04520 [Acidobacteriota bacterium]